jgi:hypothetical protein
MECSSFMIAGSLWQKSRKPLTDVRGSGESVPYRAATVRERFVPQTARLAFSGQSRSRRPA